MFIPVGGRTSYLGDVLAIVVAETREIARRAAALVEVEYAPLAAITDPAAAVAATDDAVWGLDGNVLSRSVYARGDVDAAFAASAHVVHDVFQTQRIEHAFLEPESTLAVPQPGGDGLHVYSGGQGVWDDRDQIASVLAVDADAGDRRAGVERRCVRWQGGHEQPGADRARGPVAGPTGEMHAVARGIAARAPEAPSGAHRPRGRVRRRRPSDRAAGPHARRFGPLRVGRDEGAGTGGRACLRPVPGSRGRRRSGRRRAPTTRCAARSAGSGPTRRSSRWRVRSTASPSPSASAAGRSAPAT